MKSTYWMIWWLVQPMEYADVSFRLNRCGNDRVGEQPVINGLGTAKREKDSTGLDRLQGTLIDPLVPLNSCVARRS